MNSINELLKKNPNLEFSIRLEHDGKKWNAILLEKDKTIITHDYLETIICCAEGDNPDSALFFLNQAVEFPFRTVNVGKPIPNATEGGENK